MPAKPSLINETLYFIRQNLPVIVRIFLLLIFPLTILLSAALITTYTGYNYNLLQVNGLVFMQAPVIAVAIITLWQLFLVAALCRAYGLNAQSPNLKQFVTAVGDYWIKAVTVVFLLATVIAALWLLLALLTGLLGTLGGTGFIFLSLLLAFLVIVYLTVPFMLFALVYLSQPVNIVQALDRGFKTVKGNWWANFVAVVIIWLIIVSAQPMFKNTCIVIQPYTWLQFLVYTVFQVCLLITLIPFQVGFMLHTNRWAQH